MIETIFAFLAGAVAIVLLILQRSAKTKLGRAREIVEKTRSRGGKMRFLLETRDYEALEKELERQDRDMAAVLGLSRKANSAD